MIDKISKIAMFLACCAALFLSPAWAENNQELTIVVGGNVHGKLTPTLICGGNNAGGFARKAYAVDELRETKKNVILVDNGGLFAEPARQDQELRARQSFAIYDFMELDALNLGQREFYFGVDYLAQASEKVSFPLVSSNLVSEKPLPWLKKFVIVESGGYKVGIVGVLPEKSFDSYVPAEGVKGLTINKPQEALAKVVPEVRRQADMVLLLSQLNDAETTALIETVPGIDLAVSASENSICQTPPEKGKMVMPSGINGQHLLSVTVKKENGKLVISQNDPVVLDKSKNTHPIVTQIIGDTTNDYMKDLRAKRREQKNNVTVVHSVEEFNRLIEEQKQKLQAQGAQADPQAKLPEQSGQVVEQEVPKVKDSKEDEGEEIGAVLRQNGEIVPAKIRLHRKPRQENDATPPAAASEKTPETTTEQQK